MRQACRTASDILDRVSELVRPGITTKEVDEAAADFMNEAEREKRVPRLPAWASRFPRQHLHLAKRRSCPRHRQPATDSVRRHR